MSHTLEWFEGVCAELNRQPMAATAVLTEFREQEFALEAVNSYLSNPACSPSAQFQACLILQHNSLKNWPRLSTAHKLQLRETLFNLMSNAIASSSMPPYALNKIMQVYVLFWKRDWKELVASSANGAAASVFFEHVTRIMFQSSSPNSFKHGCILLRILVEEFSNRSSAEAGLPMEFHRQAHEAFETFGLDQSLQIGMQCLSTAFQMTDVPDQSVLCITDAAKLFCEVLSWDFDGSSALSGVNAFLKSKAGGAASQNQSSSSHLLVLPRRWSSALLQPTLLNSVCDVYVNTRQTLERSCSLQNRSSQQALLQSLAELRALLIAMASFSGQILDGNAERIAYGGTVLARTVPLLDAAVLGLGSGALTFDPKLVGEFRAQECENLGTVLLRLLANFRLGLCCQMPAFDSTMLSLGRATFELSKELAGLAELQLGQIYNPGGGGGQQQQQQQQQQGLGALVLDGEMALLDGWRGDAIALFLDVWCMVLDDPLMLRGALADDLLREQGGNGSAAAAAQVSTQLKLSLRGLAADVFKQLYESVWRITICEALAEPEEEEGEDAAAIAVRNMDDLLASICSVGRANFSAALDYVRQSISATLDEADKLAANGISAPQRDVLRVLESLRVSVLFASHLCDDSFRGSSQEKSSDTPLIPNFVLDSCLYVPETTSSLLHILAQISRLLQLQVTIGPTHSLFSPLLLQVVARFFTEYFARFVDPDPSLYSPSAEQLLPHLFTLHSPVPGGGPGDLSALVEQLAAAVRTLVVSAPLEGDLVHALAEMLTTMSKGGGGGGGGSLQQGAEVRRAILIASPSVAEVFKTVTAQDCRLSLDGITQLYGALGSLAARAGSEPTMMQLCTFVHNKGTSLPALLSPSSSSLLELKVGAQQFVACLRGLATCPRGLDKQVLHGLFDACLPIVAWALAHSGLGTEDDFLLAVVLMLRDYAEHKLAGLQHQSSSALYQTCMTALQACSRRLGAAEQALSGGAAEEEAAFRSNVLLHLLELLNHLSSKDFVFDDDEDVAAGGEGERGYAFHVTVAQVLMFGFEMVVLLVNLDLLRGYPATADRYFAFAAFVTSTYGEDLGTRLVEQGEPAARALLTTFLQHLLWGAGAVDATAARLSLQAMQALAAFQASSMSRGDAGLGMAIAAEVFPAAMERLLEMVLFPASCEYGIAWDRVDACANALIQLIVLDNQRCVRCGRPHLHLIFSHPKSSSLSHTAPLSAAGLCRAPRRPSPSLPRSSPRPTSLCWPAFSASCRTMA